jgi:hypothetical protein
MFCNTHFLLYLCFFFFFTTTCYIAWSCAILRIKLKEKCVFFSNYKCLLKIYFKKLKYINNNNLSYKLFKLGSMSQWCLTQLLFGLNCLGRFLFPHPTHFFSTSKFQFCSWVKVWKIFFKFF